jgi:hypothetical protein
MPAIDFPNSPTVGQIFTAANRVWQWNSYAWIAVGSSSLIDGGTA